MLKYLVFVLIGITAALGYMYRYISAPTIIPGVIPIVREPHYYNDPSRSLRDIHVTALYFVPREKQHLIDEHWRRSFENTLDTLVNFHAVTFGGKSHISYTIYPSPIIGEEESILYNTATTEHGNPEGLRNVSREIERRVFDANGDLYPGTSSLPSGSYEVRYIMYEGPGASGSENVAFVNRTYVSDTRFADVGLSTFVHEFYHTIGLFDAYDDTNGWPLSQDMMGIGREGPVQYGYIESMTLKKLGI